MARFPQELVDRVAAVMRIPHEGAAHELPNIQPGMVHEWFAADEPLSSDGQWSAPHGVLVALVWKMLQTRTDARSVAWVGHRAWPSPRSMIAADGSRELLARSIFVRTDGAGAKQERANRIWAAQQSLACDDVAAVVWDAEGFDMVASRRMQLAAARDEKRPPVLALCVRPWSQRSVLSAASTRWAVYAHACNVSDSAAIESVPAWRAELIRGRGSAASRVGEQCVVHRATWSWRG